MKYLVTGATGFIGGTLVRQLIEAGHEVRAIVRDPARATALSSQGVELHTGDITDRASIRPAMNGVDGLFHMAAWYKVGEGNGQRAEQVNVQGTRNVLESMREAEIPKGVYTSTLAVFSDTQGKLVDESYKFTGRHLSHYDRTKWEAHYNVAVPLIEDGLPLVIVLPGVVYGPGDQSLVRDTFVDYLRQKLPMVPRKTAYCWARVEDTAAAHRLAMQQGTAGESYIVAGEALSMIEALELAERITGVPAPRWHVSPGLLRFLSVLMKPLSAVVQLPPKYHPESLRVIAGATYLGDNRKAREQLSYDPRPLAEGLPETLEYELAQLDG